MKRFASNIAMVIALVFFAMPAAALDTTTTTTTSGMIYLVPISYDNSIYKDSAETSGFYFYRGIGDNRSYEFGMDITNIDYWSGYDYDQRDYTFVLTNYTKEKKTRFGGHFVTASINEYNVITLFGGTGDYSRTDRYSQFDLYVSSYNNFEPSLMAFQISYKAGRTLKSKRNIYALTQLNLINLTKKADLHEQNYFSAEQSFTFYRDKLTTTVSGWVGKQAFSVGNDGFVVSNKAELLRGGFGVKFNYALSELYSLTLGANRTRFDDTSSDNTATSTSYTLMLGHTFN